MGNANWPQAEQQALQTFSLAWLQALLATMPHKYDDRVETLLCAISQFTDDLTPYLEAWLNTRTWTSLARLLAFIEYTSWMRTQRNGGVPGGTVHGTSGIR